MTVEVNGKPQELPENSTVADLVATLGLPSEGVAVAVDRQVIPRSQHGQTTLKNGAQVEVLRAVGGG